MYIVTYLKGALYASVKLLNSTSQVGSYATCIWITSCMSSCRVVLERGTMWGFIISDVLWPLFEREKQDYVRLMNTTYCSLHSCTLLNLVTPFLNWRIAQSVIGSQCVSIHINITCSLIPWFVQLNDASYLSPPLEWYLCRDLLWKDLGNPHLLAQPFFDFHAQLMKLLHLQVVELYFHWILDIES